MALTELVKARFGALEARHEALIAKASEKRLKRWLRDILTAASAEDLFRA